ncbi:membrane transport protein-domain-containing protein [Tuber brumale]|nr:membrane transport protein-domain-containing protein [Tuber brumale]
MSDPGASLKQSFLGALQASLSVLLTLGYGVLSAKLRLVHPRSVGDVSRLCVDMFLPALLITSIGRQLTLEGVGNYAPFLVWGIVYTFTSIALGALGKKVMNLPDWIVPAVAFNNTTSLPLLLMQSLAATGILKSIAGGDQRDAVERAKSYFLINSMVSNTLMFALGPKLMDNAESGSADDRDAEAQRDQDGDENASLLPALVRIRVHSVQSSAHRQFTKLPTGAQSTLSFAGDMVNPPLVGAIVAAFIGLIPSLHKAFFADMEDGGIFRAWLTSSISNIGDLFTALQMFVVGSRLCASLDPEQEIGEIPKRGIAFVWGVRFLLCPAVSIPAVYYLARNNLLGEDPMLWFSMMLMPVGPSAMMMSSLVEMNGNSPKDKMAVARFLTMSYAISPIICFVVVGSLKASEMAVRG